MGMGLSGHACQRAGPFTLRVGFDDSTEQTIDFLPVLKVRSTGHSVMRCFSDRSRIDPEVHTLVWPNGADFDPPYFTTGPDTAGTRPACADVARDAADPGRARQGHNVTPGGVVLWLVGAFSPLARHPCRAAL